MYFFDGLISLADRLGMVPDDVLILNRLLRWVFYRAVSFFQQRKEKKAAD